MPFPKQAEIEVPLLQELLEVGGRLAHVRFTPSLPGGSRTSPRRNRRSAWRTIDGHVDFRQGAISIRSAFQAKRWTENPVGRPEIDRFRGAIQGEYDHGVFLTTSRLSKDAMLASYKKGAITIPFCLMVRPSPNCWLSAEWESGRYRSTCLTLMRSSSTLTTTKAMIARLTNRRSGRFVAWPAVDSD